MANAGLPGTGELESFSPEEVRRALRVNLEAPIMLARELAPAMAERGDGHLVFVSSLAGKAPSPRSAIYCGDQVRAARLRAQPARRPGRHRRRRLARLPGFIREAGMFADSGAKPPPGLGTATPQQVAARW